MRQFLLLIFLFFNSLHTSIRPTVNFNKKNVCISGGFFLMVACICFYLYRKTPHKEKNPAINNLKQEEKITIDGLSEAQNVALNNIKKTLDNFTGYLSCYHSLACEIRELEVLKFFLKQHGENNALKEAVRLVSNWLHTKLNDDQWENFLFEAWYEGDKNNDETGRAVLELMAHIYPSLFYVPKNKTTLLHRICASRPIPDCVAQNFVCGFLEKLKNYKSHDFFSCHDEYEETPFFNLITNERIPESVFQWLILNNVDPYVKSTKETGPSNLFAVIFQYNYREGDVKKLRLLSILTGLPSYDEIPYERPDDHESVNIINIKHKIEEKRNTLGNEQKEMLKEIKPDVLSILKKSNEILDTKKSDQKRVEDKKLCRYAFWIHTAIKRIAIDKIIDYKTYNTKAFQGKTYLEN